MKASRVHSSRYILAPLEASRRRVRLTPRQDHHDLMCCTKFSQGLRSGGGLERVLELDPRLKEDDVELS